MSSGGGSKAFSNTTCSRYATGLDGPLMRNSEYYVTDGNKNVIEMRNVYGAVTTSYSYDPFGKLPLPMEDNYFAFSSEYYDGKTRLVYYNYRYYSPELGKWINRDPIGEEGGENLYVILKNNVLYNFDILGLRQGCCGKDITRRLNQLLQKAYNTVLTENISKTRVVLNANDGWDIIELHNNSYGIAVADYSTNHPCYGTSTYNGKCYRNEDLNYLLFGTILRAWDDLSLIGRRRYLTSDMLTEILLAGYVSTQILGGDAMAINKIHIAHNAYQDVKNLIAKKINNFDLERIEIKTSDCKISTINHDMELTARLNDCNKQITIVVP